MESNSKQANKSYCIAVDGSQYSDWAFDLVCDELYKKGDKIVVAHVANSAKLSEIPFAFQPDTIVSKYDAKLTGKFLKNDFKIVKQDKISPLSHAILQVNEIAIANNCTVLVMGFYGHKMNNKKAEMANGLINLINNIKLPTIVVKEDQKRRNKNKGAFTWMASIEQYNTRSFKAFQFAINYIDVTKDKLIGVHVNTYDDVLANKVKGSFENSCEEHKVANYSFSILDKEKGSDIGTQLANFVNYNENDSIDFVILGHNSSKFKDAESSPLSILIKSVKSNILFYN